MLRSHKLGCLGSLLAFVLTIAVPIILGKLAFRDGIEVIRPGTALLAFGAAAVLLAIVTLIAMSRDGKKLTERIRTDIQSCGLQEVEKDSYRGVVNGRTVELHEESERTRQLVYTVPLNHSFPKLFVGTADHTAMSIDKAGGLDPLGELHPDLEDRRVYSGNEAWAHNTLESDAVRKRVISLVVKEASQGAIIDLEAQTLTFKVLKPDLQSTPAEMMKSRLEALLSLADALEQLEDEGTASAGHAAPIKAQPEGYEKKAAVAAVRGLMFNWHAFACMGALVIALGCIFLSFYASMEYATLDYLPTLLWAGACLPFFLAGVYVTWRRLGREAPPWFHLAFLANGALASIMLSFALPTALNGMLDSSLGEVHEVAVHRAIRRSENRGWSAWLEVDSWRDGRERERLSVSKRNFRSWAEGQTAQVTTMPGALGMAWIRDIRRYEGDPDEPTPSNPPPSSPVNPPRER